MLMENIKVLQNQKLIKSLITVILGSVILTISAKIKIPFYPVPMTMQTFVILLIGITLGYKVGLATVTLYLLEGIVGLPVRERLVANTVGCFRLRFIYCSAPPASNCFSTSDTYPSSSRRMSSRVVSSVSSFS